MLKFNSKSPLRQSTTISYFEPPRENWVSKLKDSLPIITSDGDKQPLGTKELRKNKPTIMLSDGSKYWYRDGELDREDGPAILKPDGYQAWYTNGILNRRDGPAVIYPNGYQEYYAEGELKGRRFVIKNPDGTESCMKLGTTPIKFNLSDISTIATEIDDCEIQYLIMYSLYQETCSDSISNILKSLKPENIAKAISWMSKNMGLVVN